MSFVFFYTKTFEEKVFERIEKLFWNFSNKITKDKIWGALTQR